MWTWLCVKWEALKGYRTILLNFWIGVLFLLAELASYLSVIEWRDIVPEKYAPLVVVGINLLNIVLRFVTTGPTPLANWRKK